MLAVWGGVASPGLLYPPPMQGTLGIGAKRVGAGTGSSLLVTRGPVVAVTHSYLGAARKQGNTVWKALNATEKRAECWSGDTSKHEL